MILSELKTYLVERRRADLLDMSNRFDADADALRGMLDHWIRKGRVRRLPQPESCGGGCSCSRRKPEVYEWVG
ncbi:FeoC-like transcriptional regulator [Defluviicoccus vanus]|uniref:FeoC-like transcriptional regulator n=1 Tax=Defluviicoccus vanus TaxID=111831 RepID=A0A7H1N068_9PROT|nr:FeoC-like transcriptional regulator [Defluviicoccus vanus]QNT69104.1 FeoC-like transcriptional regulator [Defluviicoccus vanus]